MADKVPAYVWAALDAAFVGSQGWRTKVAEAIRRCEPERNPDESARRPS